MPRTLVVTFVPINIVLLFLNRVLVYGFIQWARRKGYDRKRVLIVGTGDQAHQFMETVAEHLEWGFVEEGCAPRIESWIANREGFQDWDSRAGQRVRILGLSTMLKMACSGEVERANDGG